MAAATTRSASRSTSCSRRSTTTRRPTSGAWISRFAPPRRLTPRRGRCWPHSTFPSGSEAKFLKRGISGDPNGEEKLDREEQPAHPVDEEILGPARAAAGDPARQVAADRGALR